MSTQEDKRASHQWRLETTSIVQESLARLPARVAQAVIGLMTNPFTGKVVQWRGFDNALVRCRRALVSTKKKTYVIFYDINQKTRTVQVAVVMLEASKA